MNKIGTRVYDHCYSALDCYGLKNKSYKPNKKSTQDFITGAVRSEPLDK